MFDSLNRHHLAPYGAPHGLTPNFERLAKRSATFDTSYVCSMPCMPARRDFHTGRPSFLHRGWGPLEPFDDSVPARLQAAGVRTHLITDHYHYFEDGGATYHNRYGTWEFFRGQEGDAWRTSPAEDPNVRYGGRNAESQPLSRQDRINRQFIKRLEDYPQVQTITAGLDFLQRHQREDNWCLHLETFDPHEPFDAPAEYQQLLAKHFDEWKRTDGRVIDWPYYDFVRETPAEAEHLRMSYLALLAMCDAQLGRVLDTFDALNLWEDTMLMVWTDHGFLLGEHECWAKIWAPFYEEVARTPCFIWDPRSAVAGERRQSLIQPALDFGPTLLNAFGLAPTPRMRGHDLTATIANDAPVREAALFGVFGGQVNVTDGRHVYMRASGPENQPLNEYTLMPTRMRGPFKPSELRGRTTLTPPLPWAQDLEVLQVAIPAGTRRHHPDTARTLLFDLARDPGQTASVEDPDLEQQMIAHLQREMAAVDAPPEQYDRLGVAR